MIRPRRLPRRRRTPSAWNCATATPSPARCVSIVDGMITVKTPFREVKLPVGLLRSVALKPVDLERSKRENGDVRAWFPDGSSLVFRLDAVDGENLTGFSQNFGTATFKIAAFNRIEFNIYDPEFKDIRAANGW